MLKTTKTCTVITLKAIKQIISYLNLGVSVQVRTNFCMMAGQQLCSCLICMCFFSSFTLSQLDLSHVCNHILYMHELRRVGKKVNKFCHESIKILQVM
jgi:hypothetical protein